MPHLLIPAAIVAVAAGAVYATAALITALMPKAPAMPSAAPRNVTSRTSIGVHNVVVGQTRVGGVMTWEEKTADGKYYQVITLAPHACYEIGAIYFDGDEVVLDSFGNAVAAVAYADGTTPKNWAGVAKIVKGNGTVAGDEALHSFLAANCKTWTADCRQDGRAKIAIQWTYNADALASGLPNVTAIVKGAYQFDPRFSAISISSAIGGTFTTSSPHGLTPGSFAFMQGHKTSVPPLQGAYEVGTVPSATTFTLLDYSRDIAFSIHAAGGTVTRMVFTDNPVVVGTTYLCDKDHGIFADYETEFVAGQVSDDAIACDEIVARATPAATFTADSSTDLITYGLGQAIGSIPDYAKVTVSNSGGGLPGGLSAGTVYFFKQATSGDKGYLCSSLANAQAVPPVPVNITSAGTGTHTVTLVVTFTANLATGNSDSNSISLYSGALRILTGTKVRVSNSGGGLPSGLSAGTDYYAIFQTDRRIRLAATLSDARAGWAISLSSAGTGTHFITVEGDPRYTCNGIIPTSDDIKSIADRIADTMAGDFVPTGVSFAFVPGVWRAPAVAIDESHCRGPIRITALRSAQESYNAVKGLFWDPFGNFQAADFPAYQSAAYIADDNGEIVWRDFKFDLVNSPTQAQRVARIELRRVRMERKVSLQLKFSAFRLAVADTFELSNALWSITDQVYEVKKWSFSIGADDNGIPTLDIDIAADQTAESVYDWDAADEVGGGRGVLPIAAPVTLPAPANLTAIVSGANVTLKWSPIETAAVIGYGVVSSPAGGNVSSGSVLDGRRSATEITTAHVSGNYTAHVYGIDPRGVPGPAATKDFTVSSGVSFVPYTNVYWEGSGSEVIPPGAGNVTIKGWGGGGGSGPGNGAGTKGGGAGAYFERTIALHSSDAGKTFSYTVGPGGEAGYYNPAEEPYYFGDGTGGTTTVSTPVALNAGSFSMIANGGEAAPVNSSSTAAGGTASGGSTNTTGGTSTADGGVNPASGSGAGGVFNTSNGSAPAGGAGGTTVGISFHGGGGKVEFAFTA